MVEQAQFLLSMKRQSHSKPNSKPSLRGKIKSDFPKHTLEESLRVADAIENANGGKPMPPLDVATAVGLSPGSSEFRIILSSSIKYGLTSGSFNTDRVKIETLGQRIVAATSPEDAEAAKVEAGLAPPTFRAVYAAFAGKKLPEQTFFENALVRDFAVPREHAKTFVNVFTANVGYLKLMRVLPSGRWLASAPQAVGTTAQSSAESNTTATAVEPNDPVIEAVEDVAKRVAGVTETIEQRIVDAVVENRNVFITHGKNREIVAQLKELLTFGKFIPVVSVERDTTSIPVPEKVFDDMRSCSAGIIHVMNEGTLLDKDGKEVQRINENVLIEIGAAIALYHKNFILLVQKGVQLPSNLQGLYRCEYQGDRLDYEATMKLLKTFNQFSSKS